MGGQSSGFIELRQSGSELAVGERRSGLRCPFCGGGISRENSLSISRPDEATLLYICHRASCSRQGKTACLGFRLERGISGSSPNTTIPRKPHIAMYTGTVRVLGARWVSYLLSRFGLSEEDTARENWAESTTGECLYTPLRDPRFIRRAEEIRKPPWDVDNSQPKTRSYWHIDCPRQGFFRGPANHSPIVLVEDTISALKVSRQFTTCCLVGTHLNIDKVTEIITLSRDVVIALDKDATDKSFKYQKQFGLYANFKVARLDKDLKYEPDERIKEIIDGSC